LYNIFRKICSNIVLASLLKRNKILTDSYRAWTRAITLRLSNWWKGKPSGSIACTRKQQPRFYWSCSSVVMNDATPLTPPSAWAELHFKCKQHTCTLHDPWEPEKYDYTMMYYGATFYSVISRTTTVLCKYGGFYQNRKQILSSTKTKYFRRFICHTDLELYYNVYNV